jgi:DNA-binding NarL/FixJ family response regulator
VPDGALGNAGTQLMRVAGEALVNARRHSGARTVTVRVWTEGDHLCVEVSDDGHGFAAGAEARPGSSGIRGMRERLELVRGDIAIDSTATGTTVRLGVPLGSGVGALAHGTRILLVEDHAAVREAIAVMFDRAAGFEVVGQAGSLGEARTMLKNVDVALVDLGLPDGFGGDLIKELRSVNPRAQALVLSAGLQRRETARAIESGAAGALDKTISLDEVVDAVRRVQAGETLVPLDEVVELLRLAARERERDHRDRDAIDSLSPREREVLQLLADGLDTQEIAGRLHIAARTERNHVASIFGKLDVHSRLQAVLFALRHGIVNVR